MSDERDKEVQPVGGTGRAGQTEKWKIVRTPLRVHDNNRRWLSISGVSSARSRGWSFLGEIEQEHRQRNRSSQALALFKLENATTGPHVSKSALTRGRRRLIGAIVHDDMLKHMYHHKQNFASLGKSSSFLSLPHSMDSSTRNGLANRYSYFTGDGTPNASVVHDTLPEISGDLTAQENVTYQHQQPEVMKSKYESPVVFGDGGVVLFASATKQQAPYLEHAAGDHVPVVCQREGLRMVYFSSLRKTFLGGYRAAGGAAAASSRNDDSRPGREIGTSFEADYPKLGAPVLTGDYSLVRRATRQDKVESWVKIVKIDHTDPRGLDELRHEARLLKMVKSPNVVKLHRVYEEKDAIYMAVEACQGVELFEHVAQLKTYTEYDVRNVVRQLLMAVKHLHSQNIVLKSLKAEHLFLSKEPLEGVLKIANLESAVQSTLAVDPDDDGRDPEYSAPETLMNKRCNNLADMWRVGVIVHNLVRGYPPFHGRYHCRHGEGGNSICKGGIAEIQVLRRMKLRRTELANEDWESASPEVTDLVLRMLEVDHEERITAEEALGHSWMSLPEDELRNRDLGLALRRFKVSNVKRKVKRAAFLASHVVHGLRIPIESEVTARANRVAEHIVGELQEIRQAETLEAQKRCPRRACGTSRFSVSADRCPPDSPSHDCHFKIFLRHHLVETLETGPKTYIDPEGDVRLEVPALSPGSFGPVILDDSARVIETEHAHYFVSKIVMCTSTEVEFSSPLFFGFLLPQEGYCNGGNPDLNQVLLKFQILRKDNEGSPWYAAPPNALSVGIRGSMTKANYLRIKVEKMERFSWFACGMKMNPSDGTMRVDQKDKRSVVVRNLCDVPVLVTMQPGDEPGRMGGTGRENSRGSMLKRFEKSAGFARFKMIDRGFSHRYRVSGRGGKVRLLIATREDSNDPEVATFVLKLWSSVDTPGSKEIWLCKLLMDGTPQVEDNIIRGADVKSAILALDGEHPGAEIWLNDWRMPSLN